jgi:ubiquinone/menaquinone biosynthesis C-methylase UbiE
MKILDVGCGGGFYEIILSRRFSHIEIIGADINRDSLLTAKKTVNSNRNTEIFLVLADATKLPFTAESFDRIICTEVLEHVRKDEEALSQIYRVMKKNAKAVFTVPNKNYPASWDPPNFFLERIFHVHIPFNARPAGIWSCHVRLYSKDELTEKLERARFKIENLWFSTHYCFPFSPYLLSATIIDLVPFNLLDRLNKDNMEGKSVVNLVVKLRKS